MKKCLIIFALLGLLSCTSKDMKIEEVSFLYVPELEYILNEISIGKKMFYLIKIFM